MSNQCLYKLVTYLSKSIVHAQGELQVLPYYLSSKNKTSAIAILAPNWISQHFRADALWRNAYAISLLKRKIDFDVISDPTKAKANQTVIWRPSQSLFARDKLFTSYASNKWVELARQVEHRGARIYPNSRVISFYENKVNMHNLFEGVGVKSPRTFIVRSDAEFEESARTIGLPFIVKGAHSYSSLHLLLISSGEQARRLQAHLFSSDDNVSRNEFLPTLRPPVLIQEFLNIRRDLRVVFVGEDLLLSYWRINDSGVWKPTATRFGSRVAFDEPIPQQWKNAIADSIKGIDFPWGAFDIAWQNDNIESEPYILEVSPCFEPNPPPPSIYMNDYYSFKYKSRFENNWNFHYWKTVQEVADAQVAYMLGT